MIQKNHFLLLTVFTTLIYGQPDTLWTKVYTDYWEGVSVKQTQDNGFIILANVPGPNYGSDAALIKTDNDGNVVWEMSFGGDYDDIGYTVIVTNDGGYAFVGYSESYPSYGNTYTGKDIWIVKTDSLGSLEWMNNYEWAGESGSEEGYDIIQIEDGSFLVAGKMYSSAAWQDGSGNWATVLKTSSTGYQDWFNRYRLIEDYDNYGDYQFNSIDETIDGYILTGSAYSYDNVPAGGIVLFKINVNGILLFDDIFGDLYDIGNSIQATSDGGFIIGGAKFNWESSYLDAWIIKTDADGDFEWDSVYGGSMDDELLCIRETTGSYTFTGYSTEETPPYRKSLWIIKNNINGDYNWEIKIGSDNYDVIGRSIEQTEDYGYIATGRKASGVYLVRVNSDNMIAVTISSTASSPTNVSPIPITITFDESVTGFTGGDIVVSGGTVSNFWGFGAEYDFDLIPDDIGLIAVDVPAGIAENSAGDPNSSADQFSIIYDINPAAPENLIVSREQAGSALALSWDQSSDGDVIKYRIFMDTASEPVTLIDSTVSISETTRTISNLANGATYFFRIVAVDSFGFVSEYSNEVSDSPAELLWVDHFDDLYNWANTGDYDWIIISESGDNIAYVAPPGVYNTYATLSKTFSFEHEAEVRFYSQSTGSYYSSTYYKLLIDDVEIFNLRGRPNWEQFSTTLSAGSHTVIFRAGFGFSAKIDDFEIWKKYAPLPTISSSAGTHTNSSPIPITVIFSESVTGFESEDVVITNGTLSGFSGSGTDYSFNVTPATDGVVTVDIPADVAVGTAGENNMAAVQFSITYDGSRPTVTVSSNESSPTHNLSISVEIVFSETVIDFEQGDVDIVNGSLSAFSGADSLYDFSITPDGDGTVSISIAENTAYDHAGNGNLVSNTLEIYYDDLPPNVDVNDISEAGTMDTLTISWVSTDVSTIEKHTLFLTNDGQNYSLLDSTAGDVFTYDWVVPNIVYDQNRIAILATDEWGLVAADTTTVFAIIDNDNPVVTVLEPTGSSSIPEYNDLLVEWNADDNIGLDSMRIYFSNDVGSGFVHMGSVIADSYEFTFEVPSGVTDSAQVKLIAQDTSGNESEAFSEYFIVTDNTPPTVEITFPESGDTLTIGTIGSLTLTENDNVGITTREFSWSLDNNSWTYILPDSTHETTFLFLVPNQPTDNFIMRVIVGDAVGFTDTSNVYGINVVIEYPKLLSYSGMDTLLSLKANSNALQLEFSVAMDPSTISNIILNSVVFGDISYTTQAQQSGLSFYISFSQSMASLDTLTLTLPITLLSTFGYGFDGDQDGVPGDSQMLTLYTETLADYDHNNVIDLNDLSTFTIAWYAKDYYYELGPFTGEVPHLIPNFDAAFNVQDLVAFVYMWVWNTTSPSGKLLFREWADSGPFVEIGTTPDSISITIPDGSLTYELQIKYFPSEIMISKPLEEVEIQMSHNDEETGIYTLMSAPRDNRKVTLLIILSRKSAHISVSFRTVDYEGATMSQLTRELSIAGIPRKFALHQNYPNPFNPSTTIEYNLPKDSHLSLVIFDLLGQQVKKLVSGSVVGGYHHVIWNGTDDYGKPLSSGMYFCSLRVGDYSKVRKIVLLK